MIMGMEKHQIHDGGRKNSGRNCLTSGRTLIFAFANSFTRTSKGAVVLKFNRCFYCAEGQTKKLNIVWHMLFYSDDEVV